MYEVVKDILDSIIGCDVILEIPKNYKLGHFSTTIAFTLAKERKDSPKNIARNLIIKLKNVKDFADVQEVNGFINITLTREFISKISKNFIANKHKKISNSKILLEYVSANPTGPLHIGHARGAVIGDTLARIGKYLGYDITTEYYINDMGNQITLLGKSIFISARKLLNISNDNIDYDNNLYKGTYIIDLAKEALIKFEDNIFLDSKNIDLISKFGLEKMIALIKSNLNAMDIIFDNFVSESEFQKEINEILNKLKLADATYIRDSKLWLKSSQKGDEKDRVIVKQNNEFTYLAGDISYHYNKFIRGFDKYINIWGADHHGYINRIRASINFLGFDDSKLGVLLSQMVSVLKDGKPYKMSKRAGNFILMQDVINDIGSDALRFIFLTKKMDTHLEFDINIFSNNDISNPIYYINYANARIHSIKSKSSKKAVFDFNNLEDEWIELLLHALMLDKVLFNSFEDRALQKLPEYLKVLATKFHQNYNAIKIIDSPNEAFILAVLEVVSFSITKGFDLMGIKVKTKM